MSRGEPFAVRLYRALARLAPPDFRDAARDAADLFADIWATRRGRRRTLLLRAAPRLVAVLCAEWLEVAARRLGRRRSRTGRDDVSDWIRTLRYGARGLLRAPAFTIGVLFLMSLGVGSVATVFTVADHLFLRPLPYPDSDELVFVERGSYSYPVVRELAQVRSIEALGAAAPAEGTLVGGGDPLVVSQARVTDAFFPILGARAILGRLFVADDFRQHGAVVLGAGAWRRIWGGDPGVLGRTIRVNDRAVTVVGVLDDGFEPPARVSGRSVDVWLPVDPTAEESQSRDYHDFEMVGRLAAGATLEAANAEVDGFARRLADDHPERYVDSNGHHRAMPVVSLHTATVGAARRPVLLLLGGSALLLLIACANVAHLVLARSLGRDREFAVRRAIGAGRGAVVRQVLGESLLLGGAGGLTGALLAGVAVRALHSWAPAGIPRLAEVSVDPRALLVALGISTLTAAGAGLLPAMMAARRSDAGPLRAGSRSATPGRGTSRLRAGLVVAELALSVVLVVQAGLLVRSLTELNRVDLGFRIEGLWTARLPLSSVPGIADETVRVERLRDAVAAAPGMRAATYGLTLPLEWSDGPRCCWAGFSSVDGGQRRTLTWLHPVRHDYFNVLGARLLSGSAWDRDTGVGSPRPVVINEALARALLGTAEGAVGRALELGGDPVVVIGVAAEMRQFGLDAPQPPAMYMPPAIMDRASLALRAEPGVDVPRAVREAVWSVEPNLPVPAVEPMTAVASRSTRGPRFDSLLAGTFGLVALLLAIGGLSGTLLYVVSERRREIGIRLALGAPARRIERSVAAQGASWAVLGIAIGVAGGLAVARLIQDRLFQVSGADPATLVATTGLLGTVALLASWLPARKAARTNPLETLRAD